MTHISEIVGFPGVYETLREIEVSPKTELSNDEIEQITKQYGAEGLISRLDDLVAGNLLRRYGNNYSLTTLGIRTTLLLEAINGGDLRDIYRRISRIDSSLRDYELIREGMTRTFLRSLIHRPGFGRLYFCSPWINLDKKNEDMLVQAVDHVKMRRGIKPEILVITRPANRTDTTPPESLNLFLELDASVYLSKRLHTKLYIREPDNSGGYAMAIVGSQNLTKSRYIELGIRVNSDSQMINQLIGYFLEITNHCHEFI